LLRNTVYLSKGVRKTAFAYPAQSPSENPRLKESMRINKSLRFEPDIFLIMDKSGGRHYNTFDNTRKTESALEVKK